ncbi:MAG: cyanophycin synthetase [candidate division KSB1 bacterium]|nr:cyanophycin synthetase [candidate division KSB1 bacterium]
MGETGWDIRDKGICDALNGFKRPGRFQVLKTDPDVIIDIAHNPASVKNLAALIETFYPGKSVTFVLGLSSDKDTDAILEGLRDTADCIQPVEADNPRALSAVELESRVKRKQIPCLPGTKVREGVKNVLTRQQDLICIAGSHFIYKEAVDTINYLTN